MQSLALDFLIAALACYRLSQLVPLDDGPGFVFRCLREWTLKFQTRRGGKSLVEFVNCPYCQGVWYGALLALWVMVNAPAVIDWLVVALALAGGQAFLQAMGDRQNAE